MNHPNLCTPEMEAELKRLADLVREQNPNLEAWVLAYISSGLTRYTYESWYQPADRPHVWRGKRGPGAR